MEKLKICELILDSYILVGPPSLVKQSMPTVPCWVQLNLLVTMFVYTMMKNRLKIII